MSKHQEIFDAYVKELKQAHAEVMVWWNALLASEAPDGDLVAAEQRIRPRWPAGPVSHPRIIGVYRKYYLQVDRINEEILARWSQRTNATDNRTEQWGEQEAEHEAEGPHKPQALLVDNLNAPEPDLYRLMHDLVFQPIGFNYDGDVA